MDTRPRLTRRQCLAGLSVGLGCLPASAAPLPGRIKITGKDRDNLQSAIALLRGSDFGIDMQFLHYRAN